MNLPEGWTIEARGPNADGQCSVTITAPDGSAASFIAAGERIAGRVVAELAVAQRLPTTPPET